MPTTPKPVESHPQSNSDSALDTLWPSTVDPFSKRQRLILAGLYLSKYDSLGLKLLGFGRFKEAFNVLGYALGAKPASIKNYCDEFDPLFPNRRLGWHVRSPRQ